MTHPKQIAAAKQSAKEFIPKDPSARKPIIARVPAIDTSQPITFFIIPALQLNSLNQLRAVVSPVADVLAHWIELDTPPVQRTSVCLQRASWTVFYSRTGSRSSWRSALKKRMKVLYPASSAGTFALPRVPYFLSSRSLSKAQRKTGITVPNVSFASVAQW
jgi:hypothetical protein